MSITEKSTSRRSQLSKRANSFNYLVGHLTKQKTKNIKTEEVFYRMKYIVADLTTNIYYTMIKEIEVKYDL